MINSGIAYNSHFPAGYEKGHISGLRLLRVAARARAEHGRTAVGSFYKVVSSEIFDAPGAAQLEPSTRGSRVFIEPLLATAACLPNWRTPSTIPSGQRDPGEGDEGCH